MPSANPAWFIFELPANTGRDGGNTKAVEDGLVVDRGIVDAAWRRFWCCVRTRAVCVALGLERAAASDW